MQNLVTSYQQKHFQLDAILMLQELEIYDNNEGSLNFDFSKVNKNVLIQTMDLIHTSIANGQLPPIEQILLTLNNGESGMINFQPYNDSVQLDEKQAQGIYARTYDTSIVFIPIHRLIERPDEVIYLLNSMECNALHLPPQGKTYIYNAYISGQAIIDLREMPNVYLDFPSQEYYDAVKSHFTKL